MLWCCDPFEHFRPSPHHHTHQQPNQNHGNEDEFFGVSPYPGSKYTKTQGNALMAAPAGASSHGNQYGNISTPSTAPVSSTSSASYTQQSSSSTKGDLVSVTIPQGVYPGQSLTVRSPDGRRTVSAVVPMGLGPGSTFLVQFPPEQNSYHNGPTSPDWAPTPVHGQTQQNNSNSNNNVQPFANALDSPAPIPIATPVSTPATYSSAAPEERQDESTSTPTAYATNAYVPTPSAPPAPPAPPAPTPEPMEAPAQKFLLVRVPPGIAAGSTIHVEIPGENRTVAAQVPPNVSSFHVAYTSRLNESSKHQTAEPPASSTNSVPPFAQALSQPSPQMQPQSSPYIPAMPTSAPPLAPPAAGPEHTSGRQRLMLVRVPPGITAGSTLHVSVPDEPGRILAARVPPGNVKEFHVAYEPRPPSIHAAGYSAGTSNTNGSSYQQYHPQQQQYHQQHPYNGNNNNAAGNFLLPFLGGTALGAAGMAAFGHNNYRGAETSDDAAYDYENNEEEEGNYVDSGDMDGGDMDTGDFGGY